jgi:hypothetical protein
MTVIGARIGIRPVRLFETNLHDRDQWQTQIAHLLEQAMERGLVGDRAAKDGRPVALVGEAQPVKPGGPSGLKAPLEPNLVPSGRLRIVSRCVWFAHGAPSFIGAITLV